MITAGGYRELEEVAEKVEAGERLSFEDGVRLYESNDIHTVGALANTVRQRLHGRVAYYNVNRHINYTNLCVLRCKFCSFYVPYERAAKSANDIEPAEPAEPAESSGLPILNRHGASWENPIGGSAGASPSRRGTTANADLGDQRPAKAAYELSVDQVVARAREAYEQGATEVHIVGGLHPTLPFSYYLDMCRGIRDACPQMHVKAFTAIEIIHFSRISRPRRSIGQVLMELREAGLGSLPGGGAEIFDDRVHAEAFKNKVGEAEWFEVHRTAHELGIYSNATMLYGHVESRAERVAHLIKLREHQDASIASRAARFNCVIPLSFIPEDSELGHLPGPTGLEDLKTLAVSRLMLDNFSHVKAFWIMQSPKLAQASLNWGVDDLDGTVVYYDITKREGRGTTRQGLEIDRLRRLICEAGCTPVERDTMYGAVRRHDGRWRVWP